MASSISRPPGSPPPSGTTTPDQTHVDNESQTQQAQHGGKAETVVKPGAKKEKDSYKQKDAGDAPLQTRGTEEPGAMAAVELEQLSLRLASINLGPKPTIQPIEALTLSLPDVGLDGLASPLSGSDTAALIAMPDDAKTPAALARAIQDLKSVAEALVQSGDGKTGPLSDGAREMANQIADFIRDALPDLKALTKDELKQLGKQMASAQYATATQVSQMFREMYGVIPRPVQQQLVRMSPTTLGLLAALGRKTADSAASAKKSDAKPTASPAKQDEMEADSLRELGAMTSALADLPKMTIPRYDELIQVPSEKRDGLEGLVGRMMSSFDGQDVMQIAELVFMQIARDNREEVREHMNDIRAAMKKKDAQTAFITHLKQRQAEMRTEMRTDYDRRCGLPVDDPLHIDGEKVSFDDFLDTRKMAVSGDTNDYDGLGTPPDPSPDFQLSPNNATFPTTLTDSRGRAFTLDDADEAQKLAIPVEDLLDLKTTYDSTPALRSKFPSLEEWLVASTASGGVGLVAPATSSQRTLVADALTKVAAENPPPPPDPASGTTPGTNGAPGVQPTSAEITAMQTAMTTYNLPASDILRLFDAYNAQKSKNPNQSFASFLSDTVGLLTLDQWKADDKTWKDYTWGEINPHMMSEYFNVAGGGVEGGGDPRKMSKEASDIINKLDNENYTGDNDQWMKLSEAQRNSDKKIKDFAEEMGISDLLGGTSGLDTCLVDVFVALLAEAGLSGRMQGDAGKLKFQDGTSAALMETLMQRVKDLGGGDLEKTKALAEYVEMRAAEFSRDLDQARDDDNGNAEFSSKYITDNRDKVSVPGLNKVHTEKWADIDYHVKVEWIFDDGHAYNDNLWDEDYGLAYDNLDEMFQGKKDVTSQKGNPITVRKIMDEALADVLAAPPTPEQQAAQDIRHQHYGNDPRLQLIDPNAGKYHMIETHVIQGVVHQGFNTQTMTQGLINKLSQGGAGGAAASAGGGASSLEALRTPREGAAPPEHVEGLREMTMKEMDVVIEQWEGKKDGSNELTEQIQLKLQLLMDRLQQAQTMLSNLVKKASDTSGQIIGNWSH